MIVPPAAVSLSCSVGRGYPTVNILRELIKAEFDFGAAKNACAPHATMTFVFSMASYTRSLTTTFSSRHSRCRLKATSESERIAILPRLNQRGARSPQCQSGLDGRSAFPSCCSFCRKNTLPDDIDRAVSVSMACHHQDITPLAELPKSTWPLVTFQYRSRDVVARPLTPGGMKPERPVQDFRISNSHFPLILLGQSENIAPKQAINTTVDASFFSRSKSESHWKAWSAFRIHSPHPECSLDRRSSRASVGLARSLRSRGHIGRPSGSRRGGNVYLARHMSILRNRAGKLQSHCTVEARQCISVIGSDASPISACRCRDAITPSP